MMKIILRVFVPITVGAKNLQLSPEGNLSLIGPAKPFVVLSSSEIPRGRWPQVPVLVQHSSGLTLVTQLLNKHGNPINISTMGDIIEGLSSTEPERKSLVRRLKQLGIKIEFRSSAV